MMKRFTLLLLLAALSACKGYKVEVSPPDCTVSNSQQECQQHNQTPVDDSVDENAELWMK